MKWAHPHLSATWKQVSMRTTQSLQSRLKNVLEWGAEGIKTNAIPTGTRKDAQRCWLSEKCKSKPQWGTISCQSEWLRSKSLQAINAGEGVRKGNPLTLLEGIQKCKLVQSLWRRVWRFLKNLEIELPYDTAIPLLGIHTEKKKKIERDTCTTVFITALFIIARTWKQPR